MLALKYMRYATVLNLYMLKGQFTSPDDLKRPDKLTNRISSKHPEKYRRLNLWNLESCMYNFNITSCIRKQNEHIYSTIINYWRKKKMLINLKP